MGVTCGSFRIEAVRSETPLQSRLEENVFAEVVATNMAIGSKEARPTKGLLCQTTSFCLVGSELELQQWVEKPSFAQAA